MKKETKARSYADKEVFIGIDVHKKTNKVAARFEEEVVKKWKNYLS